VHWTPEYATLVVGLLWSVTGFSGYYFLSRDDRPSRLFRSLIPAFDPLVLKVILQRAWGVLFLGIVPLSIVALWFKGNSSDYGLGFSFHQSPPGWSYAIIPLILIMEYINAPSPGNLALYPQIRVENWTRGMVLLNSISWVAFLMAYEFLFRGFLFFACLTIMDPWPAMILNVSFYAIAHLYQGPLETFGAIPLGFIFCYITLVTGNIWSAVVIHSVMALSNEWFSLRAHPHMKMVKK
jgi:membrane protease YdiL (CAAX protease family)